MKLKKLNLLMVIIIKFFCINSMALTKVEKQCLSNYWECHKENIIKIDKGQRCDKIDCEDLFNKCINNESRFFDWAKGFYE